MADTVQRLLEDMVPELEDLQAKAIFSPKEIQALVQQRQGFEYKLRRKNISKLDFLRYIQYELNVTSLVERRKVRLGIEKKGVSDFAAMRRLSFLYERALRKFNHDVALWKQYLEYSRRIGSHHAIGKILPRAIQLNPKEESLWILHASWELEYGNNVEGGRAVLQRALRLNENSRALWLAFVKMEIRFVVRVLERKRALGLVSAGADGEDLQQEGEFDLRFKGGVAPKKAADGAEEEEGEASAASGVTPLAAKQTLALTTLLVPRAIYRNAIRTKGLRHDLDFRLEFLRLLPSAYSAAMSALGDVDADDEDEEAPPSGAIAASDPSRISLAAYAYNHNEDDVLLTNFLRFNGKTNQEAKLEEQAKAKAKAEKAKEDGDEEMADASTSTTAASAASSYSRHLYHVRFVPFLDDIFSSLARDFPEEPAHTLRLRAQWAWVKAKVAKEIGEEAELTEEETPAATADAQSNSSQVTTPATPEQRAFRLFESALAPEALEHHRATCSAYYTAHRTALEVDANSPAGGAKLLRLREVEADVWQTYLALATALLRATDPTEEAGASAAAIRAHLVDLYRRAAQAGVRTEKVVRGQVAFALALGHTREAWTTLQEALKPPQTFTSDVRMWNSLFDLGEKMLACAVTAEADTAAADASGEPATAASKKRKKVDATSSSTAAAAAAGASSSPVLTVSTLLGHFDTALRCVSSADGRTAIWQRLLAFLENQFALAAAATAAAVDSTSESSIASLRSAYLSVHRAYHRAFTSVPQPRGVDALKLDYVRWMAHTAAGGEAYQRMRRTAGGQKGQGKQTKKKQKISAAAAAAAQASDDSDDDAGDSSSSSTPAFPSFVPSLSLSPAEAIRFVVDGVLATPPLSLDLLQGCINVEAGLAPIALAAASNATAASSAVAAAQQSLHVRRMKELYERCLLAHGATSPDLWFSYLAWARSTVGAAATSSSFSSTAAVQAAAAANQIHFRATKELRPEYQAEWAELQTMLVQ